MGLSWPASLAKLGDVNGLEIAYFDASTITISAGFACNDASYDYLIASGVLTVDITESGADGLDVGGEAINTWYHVFVIYDPDTATAAGLFSLSATEPTMPDGYTLKRKIGYMRNNGAGDFYNIHVSGNGRDRLVLYNEDQETTLQVEDGGNEIIWTDIDCSEFIPPGSHHGLFHGQADVKDMDLKPKGCPNRVKFITGETSSNFEMSLDDDQFIQYKMENVAGHAHVSVAGYHEEI